MSYLIKSDVIGALHEDMSTTMACYPDILSRQIVQFCYQSMEREIGTLTQYRLDSVTEETDRIKQVADAILADVKACAAQEDSPFYKGEQKVDCFVRLSEVCDAINRHINLLQSEQ